MREERESTRPQRNTAPRLPDGLDWFVYARTSTGSPEQVPSFHAQREEGLAMAERNSPSSVTVKGDLGVPATGKKALVERANLFQKMERTVGPKVLCCRDVSRLSRLRAEAPDIWDWLVTNEATLVTAKRVYWHTWSDRQLFLSDVWKAESDNIARARGTTVHMKALADVGAWLHGAPLGYKNGHLLNQAGNRVPTLVVVRAERWLVRKIFSLKAQGLTVNDIVTYLLSKDEDTDAWKKRHRSLDREVHCREVRKVLEDRRYIGQFQTAQTDGFVPGNWEALIESGTFWTCHDMIQATKKPRRTDGERFFLRDRVWCGSCLVPMVKKLQPKALKVSGEIKDYCYYRCSSGRLCKGTTTHMIDGLHAQIEGLIDDPVLRAEWCLLVDADQTDRDRFLNEVFPFGFLCTEGCLTAAVADGLNRNPSPLTDIEIGAEWLDVSAGQDDLALLTRGNAQIASVHIGPKDR